VPGTSTAKPINIDAPTKPDSPSAATREVDNTTAIATIYQLTTLMYPYRALIASHKTIDRKSLPVYVSVLARKRIAALRPIANKELAPLVMDVAAFVEAIDGLAGHTVDPNAVMTRAQNLDARFATLGADAGFIERLVREGY
jgi:hypothetical protein